MNTTETEQITEIKLDSDEFEGLLDVFRTLLQWEKELDGSKGEANASDSGQQSQ